MMTDLTPATTACHLVAFFAALVAVATACSAEEPAPDTSSDTMDVADNAETSDDSTSDADIDPCSGVTYDSHGEDCDTEAQICPVLYPACSAECICRPVGGNLQWSCANACEPVEDIWPSGDASN